MFYAAAAAASAVIGRCCCDWEFRGEQQFNLAIWDWRDAERQAESQAQQLVGRSIIIIIR